MHIMMKMVNRTHSEPLQSLRQSPAPELRVPGCLVLLVSKGAEATTFELVSDLVQCLDRLFHIRIHGRFRFSGLLLRVFRWCTHQILKNRSKN